MGKEVEWVIATDSRKANELLFMVDRAKQKKSFWSNRLDDVFVFTDYEAAKAKVAELKFNNPRVMQLAMARKAIARDGVDLLVLLERKIAAECQSWDHGKDY